MTKVTVHKETLVFSDVPIGSAFLSFDNRAYIRMHDQTNGANACEISTGNGMVLAPTMGVIRVFAEILLK